MTLAGFSHRRSQLIDVLITEVKMNGDDQFGMGVSLLTLYALWVFEKMRIFSKVTAGSNFK
jgi:hypothetical protein